MDRNAITRAATRLILPTIVIAGLALAGATAHSAPRGADGQLRIEVVDAMTGQPIAARMHLKSTRGRPVKLRLPDAAVFADHFYIDGHIDLPLRQGQFTFDIDAGPEYRPQNGHFEIERHADDTKRIEMTRFADLAKEGWYGADFDVTRRAADMPLVLKAEGLALAGIEQTGFHFADDTGLDGNEGAAADGGDEVEPQSAIARVPYAWGLPIWLARDELAAIQLIHHHSLREGVVDNEDDGRPRDEALFPGHSGNGRWSEHVYYHVLNCGLRMPPVAGSGSGTNDSPMGTNRVYAYCGDSFSLESWQDAVRNGKVFVTNGPLLRANVEGHPPGHVFYLETGDSLSLEIGLDLATRVPVDYLQIIKNGQSEAEVRLADFKDRKGRLPAVVFEESGWFLVRAVTTNQKTYQFASSGPFYVEQGGKPRISRRSVQFFLDWIDAAEAHVRDSAKLDEAACKKLLAEYPSARRFFSDLLSKANAE